MKTTLFLPVLNEIKGVKSVFPRINREWIDEIVVVDGGSTDGTIEFFENEGLQVIRQKSTGICGAYWECLEIATGDVIIPFSPDNNSIPELIPVLIEKIKQGFDMVIVSRYLDGAKSDDDDFITGFGNWLFTKIVNIFFGGKYTDTLVMFRGFKKNIVKQLRIDQKGIPVFEYMLSIRCARLNLNVCEIPGDEPPRLGGYRKMRPFYNGMTLIWVLLREFFVFSKNKI